MHREHLFQIEIDCNNYSSRYASENGSRICYEDAINFAQNLQSDFRMGLSISQIDS